MLSKPITASAWVAVESIHAQKLEFVLLAAEERNGKPHAFYTDALLRDLDAEFKNDANSHVAEHEVYGNFMLRVECETIEELAPCIERCKPIVSRWLKRYNINQMNKE